MKTQSPVKIEEKYPDSDWVFIKGSIADKSLINNLFTKFEPDLVVNLAAQAGVRYSITNPDVYIESNTIGFYNILEICRHLYVNNNWGLEYLVYVSSSSLYGSNQKVPYSMRIELTILSRCALLLKSPMSNGSRV